WSDGAQPHAVEIAHVAIRQKTAHEIVDGVGAREDDPVERTSVSAGLIERRGILGGKDSNRVRGNRFGTTLFEHVDQFPCLFSGRSHDDAAAREWTIVEPSQMRT